MRITLALLYGLGYGRGVGVHVDTSAQFFSNLLGLLFYCNYSTVEYPMKEY